MIKHVLTVPWCFSLGQRTSFSLTRLDRTRGVNDWPSYFSGLGLSTKHQTKTHGWIPQVGNKFRVLALEFYFIKVFRGYISNPDVLQWIRLFVPDMYIQWRTCSRCCAAELLLDNTPRTRTMHTPRTRKKTFFVVHGTYIIWLLINYSQLFILLDLFSCSLSEFVTVTLHTCYF